MARIQPNSNPAPEAQAQLDAVKESKGGVVNIFQTLSHSSAALEFVLQGFGTTEKMSIDAKLRESIALTVAGLNGCDYCASAHTAIGKGAGLSDDEAGQNLHGKSGDTKTQAALDFTTKLVQNRGQVSDADINALKEADFTDGEVLEITVVATFTITTNYVNEVAGTDIDFPLVSTGEVKKAA